MKITFLIGGLGPGGKERQLIYLIKGLQDSYKMQLVIFNEYVFYNEIFSLPVELVILRRPERNTLKTAKTVYKKLKKFNPDIIHTWDNISHCIALPYIATSNVKVINGSIRYAGNIRKSFLTKCLQKIAFMTSAKIVSNSNKGLLVEGLTKSKKALTIYNGIDHFFPPQTKGSIYNDLKDKLKKFNYNIVMVGRFYPLKDYLTLIKAANIVLNRNKDIGVFLIGDGPNRLEAQVEAGKWKDRNIYFTGTISDISEVLPYFDIGVLLNNTKGHAEGLSNAIMEYMLAGLPVIATNAGGTPELIQDEISGFLVPAFNPEIVAEKIQLLWKNEDRRLLMGERGQEIIRDNFSNNKMVASYYNIYNELINK